ncbi:MAG: hypothetical protein ACR2PQ_07185 [Myxococcota bacterium]
MNESAALRKTASPLRLATAAIATLPGFLEYCATLPRSVVALLRRHRSVRVFPLELTSGPAEGERS